MNSYATILTNMSPVIKIKQGIDLINQNKFQDAITIFSEVMETDKSYYEAIYWRATANFQMGNFEDAIKDFESFLHPEMNQRWKLFANYIEMARDACLRLADIAERKNNPKSAKYYYAKALNDYPLSANAHIACAEYYKRIKEYNIALKAYTNVIELIDKDNIDAYLGRANTYIRMNKKGYALTDYYHILMTYPEKKEHCMILIEAIIINLEHGEYLTGIKPSVFDEIKKLINDRNYSNGCEYLKEGRKNEAIQCFEEYYKHDKSRAFKVGCKFLECNADDKATECFNFAYKNKDIDSYDIGFAFFEYGRNDRAIKCFKHAIGKGEGKIDVQILLGRAYLALNKLPEAYDSLVNCIGDDLLAAEAWYYIADVFKQKKEHEKVLIAYENSISSDIFNPCPYIKRAEYCMQNNNYKQANADYSSLIHLLSHNKNPDIFFKRAMTFCHFEKYGEAILDLYMAITLKPAQSKIDECKILIANILNNISNITQLAVIDQSGLYKAIRNLSDSDQFFFLGTIIHNKNSVLGKFMRPDGDEKFINEIKKYFYLKFKKNIPSQCEKDEIFDINDKNEENNHGYRL